MNRIRWIGIVLVLLLTATTYGQTQLQTDEQTLKSNNLPTDAKGLVDFFEKRSMKDGDAKHLALLVKRLDSVFSVREASARELISRGPVALPFLKDAVTNPTTLETKRRAEDCIEKIQATMQSEPISAAARVLTDKKDPKAALALFNFVPSVTSDPHLEEEVLACVGRLTITLDRVDPLIVNALKDPLPFRRQAAAYLVGRRANAEHRGTLRELLADPDLRVRERVATGLFGKRPVQTLQDALTADEAVLKSKNIDLSEKSLLEFFKKRTLSESDQKRFRKLVRDLGSEAFPVRESAFRQLIKEGPPVLAFLKEAEYDANAERSHRAKDAMAEIRLQNNTAVPIAAAHLLARPVQKVESSPAEAIRTLLAYIPFSDDNEVEEETLTCLTLLCIREPRVEPELIKALDDPSPIRRSAAAFVLGHVGVNEQVAKVQPLLDDLNPVVRLRAAQGLLAARNKKAVPSFVSLIESVPTPYLPRVEETLFRIANDEGPSDPITPDSRAKAAKTWSKWIADNQSKIDLTNVGDRESYLGLITICEYDNQVGQIFGQVWETPRGGAKRWSFGGNNTVQGAMDAQTLPNGRVLVAENNQNRITERDTTGAIKWEYRIPVVNGVSTNPICVQRLPNGNTFIASYNSVMEINVNKEIVYRHNPGPQFYIFSAHKAKNGNIVAITAQGQILELDAKSGQQKNMTQALTQGNWCSVEMMPNGNYLVASMATNSVREIDRKNGQEVWSKQFPGVFRATRLPNGNVIAASMTTKQVAEFDRAGTTRWSVTCQGRPWGIHYR
jgi:HEAT repeat protein